uniref:HEAT repeat domain-containing protein n=1 Tax=uncultured Thiotrichaceae bacterium TaxID=298394 RepID=A0A6S6UM18_9GAMM|nr:MAG: Unknown protein [uncultured Thiotrichaceae bacterium]
MPKRNQNTEEQLADLNQLYSLDDEQVITQTIEQALHSKSCRVIAKAAKICEEKLLYQMEDELIASYQRLLKQKDPNCLAKSAIMRALVVQDCHDVDFYLAGLRYVQNEPGWGGPTDSAVDIRCSSAMGLVSTTYPRAMVELLTLLNDPEPNARMGAARAIKYGLRYEATLVFKQKLFCGDEEPEVLGECMSGLLTVDPDYSLPFIATYLDSTDDLLFELAALALGDSRLDEALEALQAAWGHTFAIHAERRRALFKAIALHRSDDALDWLLGKLEDADAGLLETGIEVLAVYKHRQALKDRMEDIVAGSGNRRHHALYREYWG